MEASMLWKKKHKRPLNIWKCSKVTGNQRNSRYSHNHMSYYVYPTGKHLRGGDDVEQAPPSTTWRNHVRGERPYFSGIRSLHPNHPKLRDFKEHSTVSMGQRTEKGLAGQLWHHSSGYSRTPTWGLGPGNWPGCLFLSQGIARNLARWAATLSSQLGGLRPKGGQDTYKEPKVF